MPSGSDWIPVGERLPELDEEVWVYCDEGMSKGLRFKTDMLSDCWLWSVYDFHGHYDHEDVTHWMPLPEPPEGK